MEHQAVEVEEGLNLPLSKADRVEVPMSYPSDTDFTPGTGAQVLWTQHLTGCRAVATFDPQNGDRTLTHLGGGNANESFYKKLAEKISEHTTIIIANGDEATEQFFENDARRIKDEILEAMRKLDKPAGKLSWKTFFLTVEIEVELFKKVGLKRATFVVQPDGKYGRAKGELPGRGQ